MKQALAVFAIFAALANAQTASQPAFDAASVKPGGADFVRGVSRQMKGGPGAGDPGRISYTQVELLAVIMKAWDLKFDQLSAPSWITNPAGLTAAMRANLAQLVERAGPEQPQTPDAGSGLPNIFNALEKQLGLKLVKVKDVPVDVLVIDHVEKAPARKLSHNYFKNTFAVRN